ncbi:hypothetical protein K6119_02495 [Paracrocinitomix mangrovi]|uniref:hypothetical protein n=1 Tax=Paracrocinitomix mangrovi TaxID=2862509 RepID=UPI001EDA3850|nr:hypothetical protein [Paracrocinitomix mangrovi]UKN02390.1 hypothetical protein K6119_02495 [Paracrocinitomix mangrovi]
MFQQFMNVSTFFLGSLSFFIATFLFTSCNSSNTFKSSESVEQGLNSIQGSWIKIKGLDVNQETGESKYYEHSGDLRYNQIDFSGDTLRLINYPYCTQSKSLIKVEGDTIFYKDSHELAFFYEFRDDTLILMRYLGNLLEENYFVSNKPETLSYNRIKNCGVNWEAFETNVIWQDVNYLANPDVVLPLCFEYKKDFVPMKLNLSSENSENYYTRRDSLYYTSNGNSFTYKFQSFNEDKKRLYLSLVCPEGGENEQEIHLWFSQNE